MDKRVCKRCGIEKLFTAFAFRKKTNKRDPTCRACYERKCRKQVGRVCDWCGSSFTTQARYVEAGKGRFCSRSCLQKYITSLHTTAEGWRVRRRLKRQADPTKDNARSAVYKAVKAGKLIRSACVVCGESKVEGHHKDYSKPLDVVWLCRRHHRDVEHGYLDLARASA